MLFPGLARIAAKRFDELVNFLETNVLQLLIGGLNKNNKKGGPIIWTSASRAQEDFEKESMSV